MIKLFLPKKDSSTKKIIVETTEEDVQQRIDRATDKGLNVDAAKQEIETLKQRQTSEVFYLSLFGEVNMGKSTIIKAILPQATITTSLIAGTTQEITHYQWVSPSGDKLILSDVPGTEQINASKLSETARTEAIRAHIVIYVCDGDLSRTQYSELQLLYAFNKPVIIALNKSDLYDDDELLIIHQKLLSQLPKDKTIKIVTIHSKEEKNVIRINADGSEEMITRPANTDITPLIETIQNIINNHSTLDQLRDTAVLSLASAYLDEAESEQQHQQASEAVNQYTKRAIIGAMAAVSPGTDLIIQAYLGTSMVRKICGIYNIPVRDFDIDTLLKLIQSQVGKSTPVILAIIGNGLKAFPGIGTLAGGLVHATAYGLIFDALGKTLVKTLATHQEFRPAMTARIFQETLNESMETSTKDIIKIVLSAKQKGNTNE